MGLAIEVGCLAKYVGDGDDARADQFREDMTHINAKLEERDLSPHSEPQSFDNELAMRASLTSFPYSWLHYLRRFAAHAIRDPKWVPYPIQPGEDPAADPVLHQMYRQMRSHLLCHSDREGYYIPVDFGPLILDPSHEMRGGVVGSSQQLRQELISICNPLEIELNDQGELDDQAASRLSTQRPNETPFAIERLVWLALYEAATVSIEEDTAIVFC